MNELDKLRKILGDRPLVQLDTRTEPAPTPAPRLRAVSDAEIYAWGRDSLTGEQVTLANAWDRDVTELIQMVTPETPAQGLPIRQPELSWAELVPPRAPKAKRYDEADLVGAALSGAVVGLLFGGLLLGVLW